MVPWENPTRASCASVRPVFLKLEIEEAVEHWPRHAASFQHARGRAVHQAEPLAAGGRHVVGKRRVRCDERGMGQRARDVGRQPDQIVAVGADTMQQHHQLARRAAGCRAHARSVEHREARRAGRAHWRSPLTISM